MKNDAPLYLVDGSGYIFRAFFAVAPLTTKGGFPTNALFGFTKMLLKLIKEAKSSNIIVCFDTGKETFRKEIYQDYKANRSEPPEELVPQFPYFKQIAAALGLKVLDQEGFEADDIIATIAERFKSDRHPIVIVSADKDLMQLVGGDISMWDTMRDKVYGPNEVKEKMGVMPERIVDLLALTGDASDNVPGLKGVGPKTATQLIELYGDVESILGSADKIKNDVRIRSRAKIAESIECQADTVRLSKKLVTVEKKVPLMTENFNFERAPANTDTLRILTEKFEFKDLFGDLIKADRKIDKFNYKTVWASDFSAWVEKFLKQKEFAIDTETTSLDPFQAKIVGVSICWDNDEAFYIPIGHADLAGQVTWQQFVDSCKTHLQSSDVKIVGQNLKYDLQIFQQHGIEINKIYFDTMIAAYLLNSEQRSYSLDLLAEQHLDRHLISYKDLVGEMQDFSFVAIEQATDYAAQDAHVAWLLKEKFTPLLEAEELMQVFYEVEMPLVPVLAKIELAGVGVDIPFLKEMSQKLGDKLNSLEKEIYATAKGEFNINSPKQLSEVLFERLQIPTKGLKKTKTGTSTDSSVLEKLQSQHPIVDFILQYRMLHKLKSTYVDSLPLQVSEITGRIHSKLHQTGTGTGRLSSSDPNLQNIPINTTEGRKIRAAFCADKGNLLLSADYSQIELRVLAHMSGDENLLDAFSKKIDIHAKTAREIFNVPEGQEITVEQRRHGKTINFGVVYGISAFRLAGELGIPVKVAQQYIDNYFDRYPKVNEYFTKLEQQALEKGEVRTLLGRKRKISALDTSERDKGFLLRAAVNAPLQGTAADIIKVAMVKVADTISKNKYPFKMILQVHDELLFECRADFAESAKQIIKDTMEGAIILKLPLTVDVGIGETWATAH